MVSNGEKWEIEIKNLINNAKNKKELEKIRSKYEYKTYKEHKRDYYGRVNEVENRCWNHDINSFYCSKLEKLSNIRDNYAYMNNAVITGAYDGRFEDLHRNYDKLVSLIENAQNFEELKECNKYIYESSFRIWGKLPGSSYERKVKALINGKWEILKIKKLISNTKNIKELEKIKKKYERKKYEDWIESGANFWDRKDGYYWTSDVNSLYTSKSEELAKQAPDDKIENKKAFGGFLMNDAKKITNYVLNKLSNVVGERESIIKELAKLMPEINNDKYKFVNNGAIGLDFYMSLGTGTNIARDTREEYNYGKKVEETIKKIDSYGINLKMLINEKIESINDNKIKGLLKKLLKTQDEYLEILQKISSIINNNYHPYHGGGTQQTVSLMVNDMIDEFVKNSPSKIDPQNAVNYFKNSITKIEFLAGAALNPFFQKNDYDKLANEALEYTITENDFSSTINKINNKTINIQATTQVVNNQGERMQLDTSMFTPFPKTPMDSLNQKMNERLSMKQTAPRIKCPHCYSEQSSMDATCNSCGKPLKGAYVSQSEIAEKWINKNREIQASKKKEGPNFCRFCGANIISQTSFNYCRHCGKKL